MSQKVEYFKKYGNISKKVAIEYTLSNIEANEIERLIEGLIMHLMEETDSLVPAFIVSDLDVRFYDAVVESDSSGGLVEECPSGYEVRDYQVDFVRNPDNHELVISYKQLLDKMSMREYDWDWSDLTKSEKEEIQRVMRNYVKNHDWLEVDKTYVYDDDCLDAIVSEGKSQIKLGIKCEREFFTIFVLKARPSEEPLDTAADWLAERMYKARGNVVTGAKGDKCGERGCIRKREVERDGEKRERWGIVSGKTGKWWPQTFKTKEDARKALKHYHAGF